MRLATLFLIGVVLLSSASCSSGNRPNDSGRQVIGFDLPDTSAHGSAVVLVEFGSVVCGECRRFVRGYLPDLDSAYFMPGLAEYHYLDLAPDGLPSRFAALAECVSMVKGRVFALGWVHRVMESMNEGDAVRDASKVTLLTETELNACRDNAYRSDHRVARRQTAAVLEVPGTPTFIIGLRENQAVRGWVVVGVPHYDTMTRLLDSSLQARVR